MGLYEGIKDLAKVIQKADNIELYSKLLDLSSQALDMQNEIAKLSSENMELKKHKDISERIERNEHTFVTLRDDETRTRFCSRCWDVDGKMVQVRMINGYKFECPNCSNKGILDKEKYDNSNRPIVTYGRQPNKFRY